MFTFLYLEYEDHGFMEARWCGVLTKCWKQLQCKLNQNYMQLCMYQKCTETS